MTKWDLFKEYINSKPIGEIISRKQMQEDLNIGSFYTMDMYKAMLLRTGFLQDIARGKYKILCHIKPDATTNQIREAAFKWRWRSWFNDLRVLE